MQKYDKKLENLMCKQIYICESVNFPMQGMRKKF